MNVIEMRTKVSELLARCTALAEADELTESQKGEFDAKLAEAQAMDKEIAKREELEALQKAYAQGDGQKHAVKAEPDQMFGFKDMGDFLQAVARSSGPGAIDKRLAEIKASGLNEATPSEGGFLVAPGLAGGLLRRVYETGQITRMVSPLPLTSGNSVEIQYLAETSRATGSRWGGIQTYWVAEGVSPTASKPAIGKAKLQLNKLSAAMYATEEVLEDAPLLTALVNEVFPLEFAFAIEDAFVNGTGAGQPMGVLNAACKVSVTKETGQAADTVVFQNILKMWSRLWARSRTSAVWLIAQDVEPQLYGMSMAVGTGGVPVYLPAGGVSGSPYATLFGRPVIPHESCDKLGDEGDIILADWGEYGVIDKGGLNSAVSLHVKFLEDEQTFRWTYRVDGQPKWASALTPKNGSGLTQSPFVTLGAR
ncbi:MAG: phage major capsid protein [bacterium]